MSSPAQYDIESLSNLERLILAQAVYEFGSNKWDNVSTILSTHSMLHRPKNYFTPEACNQFFLALMKDAELEPPDPEHSRRAPAILHLAQVHYIKRMQQIRHQLDEGEREFRELVSEIDLIRAGKWDEKIRAEFSGEPQPPQVTEPSAEPTVEPSEPEPAKLPSPAPTVSEETQPDSSQIVEQMLNKSISTSTREQAAEAPVVQSHSPQEQPQTEPSPAAAPETSPEPPKASSPDVENAVDEALKEEAGSSSPQAMEGVEEDVAEEETEQQAKAESPAMDVDAPEETAPPVEEKTSPPESARGTPAMDQDVEMVATPQAGPSHEGKRKTSEALSEPPRERKRLREDSEQLDEEEPGPSTAKGRRKGQGGDKKFQNVIGMLHSTISQHRYGNIFHNPIKKSEAPDYSDLVKRPMDLKTIKTRVKDGQISNSLEFQRDVYLMFANAMMYNRPGSEIYAMAEEMMLESEIQINSFRQTEGFHHK